MKIICTNCSPKVDAYNLKYLGIEEITYMLLLRSFGISNKAFQEGVKEQLYLLAQCPKCGNKVSIVI
jgi:DNA-directed RNA polymerase subunit RPC12/RpoP